MVWRFDSSTCYNAGTTAGRLKSNTMKKTINFRGHAVNLNGLKAEIEAIENGLRCLKNLNGMQRTLGGIIGRASGEHRGEYAMDGWAMFGTYPLRNPETLDAEIKALVDKMQPELTLDNFKLLLPEVKAIYENHINIKDDRQTEEQANEQARISNEREKARELFNEGREMKLGMFHPDGLKADVKAGQMGIVIMACYDDSDIQTDYFHRDASLSKGYLLGVTGNKARRENVIRELIDGSEELRQLTWKWDSDKCRMESGIVGISQYSEKKEVHYYYIIRYGSEANQKECSKWFKANLPMIAEGAKSETSNTGAYVKINEAKQGVEIHFPVKPIASVLEKIKSRGGWRWAKFNKCWYARLSDSNVSFANEICGTHVEAKVNDGAGAMIEANEEAGYDNWAANNL